MRKYLIATLFLLASLPALASMEDALSDFKKGNYGAAIKSLNSLGDAGNVPAQIMLGALYSKGGAVPRDDKMAAVWFEKAATQGNAEAQYQLGNLYENSQLPKDYKAAANWYLKSAQQGSAKAQARLGVFYSHGLGVTQNPNEAILWAGKAALQGNADAQYWFGLGYLQGKRAPKNTQLAMGWLAKAAAQNHTDALLLMAQAYQRGEGAPKDAVLSYALNKLALANKASSTATQRNKDLTKRLSPQQLEKANTLAAELQKPNNFSNALNTYIATAHKPLFRFFERPAKHNSSAPSQP
jgi:TPR repeat protein